MVNLSIALKNFFLTVCCPVTKEVEAELLKQIVYCSEILLLLLDW